MAQFLWPLNAANRMVLSTAPGEGAAQPVTTTYSYDGAGNRTSVKTGDSPAIQASFDDAGYQTSAGQITYSHDEVGNLTSVDAPGEDADRCYFYDAYSNLRSAMTSSTSGCAKDTGDVIYSYDALDRLAQQRILGAPTELRMYEGLSQNLSLTREQGSWVFYSNSPWGPRAIDGGEGTDYFLTDLHSDVVGTADAYSGEITGSKLYSPWGEPKAGSGHSSLVGFQGDMTDPRTGLVDMGARLYAPDMGAFTTQDPLFGDL